MASMVRRLSEKPSANIAVVAPISEIGIATSGTSAVRTEPRKRNTIRPTIITVSERVEDLLERVLHVDRAVVGETDLGARRQRVGDLGKLSPERVGSGDLVGARNGHTDRYGILAVVPDVGARLLRAQFDRAEVGDADDAVSVLADDQTLEFLNAAQVGVGEEIDLNRAALGLADRGEEVVPGGRDLDLLGGNPECSQPFSVQPDPHRLRTRTFETDPLNVRDRA